MGNKKVQRPVTTRDVAAEAGVNQSTVSRALRNDLRVSAKTRERVVAAAEKLRYRPNPLVSAFTAQVRGYRRSPEYPTLAILNAYEQKNHAGFLDEYIRGAMGRAEQLGFKADVFSLEELEGKSRRLLDILRARAIRGLLILPLPLSVDLSGLAVEHFACATIERNERMPRVHHALPDYYRHMEEVVRGLRERGYRRIGYCTAEDELSSFSKVALSSYLLAQQSMEGCCRLEVFVDRGEVDRKVLFADWVGEQKPDVIVSNNQWYLRLLGELGLSVPGDVGFVALTSDGPFAGCCAMDQQLEMVGAVAMDLVISQLFRNEYGLPVTTQTVFVDGLWREGDTLRYAGSLR